MILAAFNLRWQKRFRRVHSRSGHESTCPGSWPSSSPRRQSCLPYDPPGGANRQKGQTQTCSGPCRSSKVRCHISTNRGKSSVEQLLLQPITLSQRQLISCNQTQKCYYIFQKNVLKCWIIYIFWGVLAPPMPSFLGLCKQTVKMEKWGGKLWLSWMRWW